VYTILYRTIPSSLFISSKAFRLRIGGIRTFAPGHIPPDISHSRAISPPFSHGAVHSPLPAPVTTIHRSSDAPLTCTKLIEVDRLGSEVRVSASFQMFALKAVERCSKWGGKLSGEEMSGDMSNGVMSYIRSSGSVLWTACIVVRIQFTDSTCILHVNV